MIRVTEFHGDPRLRGDDGAKRDIDGAGVGISVPLTGGLLRLRQFYFYWRLPAFGAMFGDNRGVDTAPYIELGA